jgi:phage shock protein A
MGIFQRLGRIISSNINALLSKAEDPEKMLEQLVKEMDKQLLEAKKQVAVAIADEKRLARQWEKEVREAKEWERKAMVAVRAGDDALAKEALARKRQHQDLADQYKQQWEAQRRAVEQLKQALVQLSGKIEEAKRKKALLIARKKRAEAQKAINETLAGLSESSALGDFQRMEERIDQMAAEAEAGIELHAEMSGTDVEQKFRQLEAGAGGDMELESLKRKMGLLPPAQEEKPAELGAAEPVAAADDLEAMSEEQLAAEIAKMKQELAEATVEAPPAAAAEVSKKAGA